MMELTDLTAYTIHRRNMKLTEKSKSKSQQRLFGMALAYKRGEFPDAPENVKQLAKDMSEKDLEDFAATKHKGIPNKAKKKKNESLSLIEIIRKIDV